jgi:hypothetical protein
MAKDQMSSPFQNAFGSTLSETPEGGSHTMDRNSCPQFSKPHDCGPDTIPLVFETTVEGRGNRERPGKDAAMSSTMGGGVAKKS